MEEFIKKYGGYIIGFLFTPITWTIFKIFKNRKITKKHNSTKKRRVWK